jgi:chromosomal replication initiation ATPase DnaA
MAASKTRTEQDYNRSIGLAQAVAAHAYGLTLRQLTAQPANPATTRPRQVAMYLARVALRLGSREIGRAFGRDHKAVLHACRRIEAAREDPAFDRTVEWLESFLRRAAGMPV